MGFFYGMKHRVSSIFHKQQFLSKFQPFRNWFGRWTSIEIGSVDGWWKISGGEKHQKPIEIWLFWLGDLTIRMLSLKPPWEFILWVRDSTDHTSLVSMRDFETGYMDFSPRFPYHLFPSMYKLICLKGSEAMFGTWLVLHFWQLVRNYGWNDFANGIPSRNLAWQMFFFFFTSQGLITREYIHSYSINIP